MVRKGEKSKDPGGAHKERIEMMDMTLLIILGSAWDVAKTEKQVKTCY